MEVSVISLDRTPERWQSFKDTNETWNSFRRFRAIDGNDINCRKLIDEGYITPGLVGYNKQALGCAMSHILLWQRAVKTKQSLTVIEDDVILSKYFRHTYIELVERFIDDYDIIVWGWNFDCPIQVVLDNIGPCMMSFNEKYLAQNPHQFSKTLYSHSLHKLQFCFGTPCYTVSPKGARKMLAMCLPLSNFTMELGSLGKVPNEGIDIQLNACYNKINAYVCFPPTAITLNDKTMSTIKKEST